MANLTTAHAGGIAVERSRTDPASREECPVIAVEFVNDVPTASTIATTDWLLTIQVVVCMRGGKLDADADPIIETNHRAIMADQSLGGLTMDTEPGPARWKFAAADGGACDIESQFIIQYRTSQRDLSA